MQQEEAFAARAWVLQVQRTNTVTGEVEQGHVCGAGLRGGIHEVTQKREVQVFITVGQKAHLKPFDQFLDIAGSAQHAGHRDQGPGFDGNARGVVQPWQKRRFHGQGHQPVDQANGQPAGGQQNGQGHGRQYPGRPAFGGNANDEAPGQQAR
ncbi:hypothetical protein D3C81_1691810 [compost metagenome]